MDKICIKNLKILARHGVLAEEKRVAQTFMISAEMYTDTRRAGQTDDLANAIDYGEAAGMIDAFVRENTFDLVETIAEGLAAVLLRAYPQMRGIKLRVEKPQAPVGLPLETVAVEITRKWHSAYIALGSNMGNKEAYLKGAVQALDDLADCRVIRVSTFLETEPYGYREQENFLNGCLLLETLLPPAELLEQLHRIEQAAGRERVVRWGPRTLDLDILLYDQAVVDTDALRIPHPDMHNRAFVLQPLAEIAPYAWHPLLNRTAAQLLAAVRPAGGAGEQR